MSHGDKPFRSIDDGHVLEADGIELHAIATPGTRPRRRACTRRTWVRTEDLPSLPRRLERTLGATLFIRTNRSLQLTDIGRILIPLATSTVRSANRIAATAREATTLTGGSVSFGTFSSAYRYLLTPLITEFHAHYPQVQIKILGLNSSAVAQAVRSGDLEAGLVQLPIDDHGLWVSNPCSSIPWCMSVPTSATPGAR
jgi:DNA-binding transcriptional LysR family regulator